MPNAPLQHVATLGIDIGKNSFHLIGLDARGAIVLHQKLSRGQVEARLANMAACLIGMEACVGAHHLSRQLLALGHDVKLIPAQFVKPFRKSHKNDFRDAEAIAEAVLRPTMRFVPTKTVEQLDASPASGPITPGGAAHGGNQPDPRRPAGARHRRAPGAAFAAAGAA